MSGSVTINNVDDKELATIFEFKAKHERLFGFNPQQMAAQQIPGSNPPRTGYNGVTFSWQAPAGLRAVIELLEIVERHRSGHNQAGTQRA